MYSPETIKRLNKELRDKERLSDESLQAYNYGGKPLINRLLELEGKATGGLFNWLFARIRSSQKNGTNRVPRGGDKSTRRLKYGKLQRELAEALLWRDENVSCAAIPAPLEQQPACESYLKDAEYLLDWLSRRFDADGKYIKGEENDTI